MKKLLNDSPFFEYMGKIGDWMILNILFVVTSLPMITVGMSVTAMYKVAMRIVRKESIHVAKEYFEACRDEWKKATATFLLLAAAGLLLTFDFVYCAGHMKLLCVGAGILLMLWAFLFCYIFPLQARFSNTLKNTIVNSLYLSVRNLPATLIILILNAMPLLCVAAGPFAAMMAMPVYLLIGFGLTAMINSILFNKMFSTFVEQEGENDED